MLTVYTEDSTLTKLHISKIRLETAENNIKSKNFSITLEKK